MSKIQRASNRLENESSLLRKSSSLNNLYELESSAAVATGAVTTGKLDINQNQTNRSALMEKKRQQWMQEKENSEDWMFDHLNNSRGEIKKPFGRTEQEVSYLPTNQFDQSSSPPPPPQPPPPAKRKDTHKRPPPVPKDKDYREVLDEYNKIKSTIEAITQAENKIKHEQYEEDIKQREQNSYHQNNSFRTDQSRLPAAMRTSIMFGVSYFFVSI